MDGPSAALPSAAELREDVGAGNSRRTHVEYKNILSGATQELSRVHPAYANCRVCGNSLYQRCELSSSAPASINLARSIFFYEDPERAPTYRLHVTEVPTLPSATGAQEFSPSAPASMELGIQNTENNPLGAEHDAEQAPIARRRCLKK